MKEGELGKIYQEGEYLFKEGDKGDVMYVIQSGKVKITKDTPSGESTIAVLETGEILGEMALFDRMPRSANAKALGKARVLTVDKKKLFSTISRDPTMVFKILESMSHRIRKLNEELTKLKQHNLNLAHVCMNMTTICTLMLQEAKRLVNAENGSVMLLDEQKKYLKLRAYFGSESDAKIKMGVGEGIAGHALRHGRSVLVTETGLSPDFIPGGLKITSMICLPLVCQDTIFGVINLSNSSDRRFTPEDLEKLNDLSGYASIAIHNAKNFCEMEKTTTAILKHASLG